MLPRKKEPQKLPDILSPEEIERIIKVTKNLTYRTMFILSYGAGLRASEIVNLTIKDIDSQRGMIHIRSGKGNKDRYVILSPMMLDCLRTYWQKCRLKKNDESSLAKKENEFIFLGYSGKPLSPKSVAQAFHRSKQKAGIRKSGRLHALRHSFATHTLEAGVDLYAIKQLLGHSSMASTVRYVRMTMPILQSISSPVDKLKL